MRVLLIQPPIRDFYQTSIRTQPIGLAYLAASLKSHGYEVGIVDCQTSEKRSIPIPPELSYLKDFYPFNDRSPFKLYTGYYHFGWVWDEIRERIKESKAEVFGISSSFTPYHQEALEIARIIKEWDHKKMVVMGGCHVSCSPESVLESPWVDYVVLGEGEIRFPYLLKQIEKGVHGQLKEIDGIGFKGNGTINIHPPSTFIEDIENLPFPARELLDLNRYRVGRKRSTMIITSRGCPQGCAYCATHRVMGTSFRFRSPESVVQEMLECWQKHHIRNFDIEDDNFTFDQRRVERLMNLVVKTFGEETVELSAMNGVSFASLDYELLKLMKRAGFKTINLSFVSVDASLKEKLDRPGSTEIFGKVLEEAARVGLNVIAYAILGMPGQTIGEMVDTLIYLMGKRVLIGPSIYYPTPGTPLFEYCKANGFLPPHPSQWRSSALPIETEDFHRLDIATLFRLTRIINLIKAKVDEGELDEGITWRELYEVLKEKVEAEGISSKEALTWIGLLLIFFKERSFFSLRKGYLGKESIFREKTSRRVVDTFFEKAWNRPFLKSRNV
ncbi:MAG: B12-binding domain-containing radical SAM protein [Thermodesulfobacteriota bacterium]